MRTAASRDRPAFRLGVADLDRLGLLDLFLLLTLVDHVIGRELHAQFIARDVSVAPADHAAIPAQPHELSGDRNTQVWVQQRLIDSRFAPGLTGLRDLAKLSHSFLGVLLHVFPSEMQAE